MLRIGIFGGTFSPPHNGHIYIAREAMKRAGLDRVVFIPCGNPYHKTSRVTVDARHRFEMVRLAIEGETGFEVCDIEVKSNEPSYTAKTLEKLQKVYPDDRLCFIMGGDSLIDMERWYHPEEIFKRAEIIVAERGGIDSSKLAVVAKTYREKFNADIRMLDVDPVTISASEVRDRLESGNNTDGMISAQVFAYIKEKKLYKESV